MPYNIQLTVSNPVVRSKLKPSLEFLIYRSSSINSSDEFTSKIFRLQNSNNKWQYLNVYISWKCLFVFISETTTWHYFRLHFAYQMHIPYIYNVYIYIYFTITINVGTYFLLTWVILSSFVSSSSKSPPLWLTWISLVAARWFLSTRPPDSMMW